MNEKAKKFLSAAMVALFVLSCSACGRKKTVRVEDGRELTDFDYTIVNTVSRDQYGRTSIVADGLKTDRTRYVGMFFYIQTMEGGTGHYNVSELMERYGDDFWEYVFRADTAESPVNQNHFWGEPVWGYYRENDEWVMRKQIEMLTMAGVDFLMLDTSNAVIYEEVTDKLFRILSEYRSQGWKVPQIVYQTASGDADVCQAQVKTLYYKYYTDQSLSPIWFSPTGKPMMVVMNKTANQMRKGTEEEKTIADFFSFRYKYWPTETTDLKDLSAPWMDFEYPQRVAGDWISVSCAQHTTAAFSDVYGSRGRGWDGKNDPENFGKGANYQRQWDTVFEKDAEITYTFLTQWNEWTAAKYYLPSRGGYIMVDTFNAEFSRDLEPTRTGTMQDNFYMQTVQNIRRYKFDPAPRYAYPDRTIDIADPDAGQWSGVPAYLDFTGECVTRNFIFYDGSAAFDDSNRNDIARVQVASDRENLYFRVETVGDITPYESGDRGWMNLWIRTGNAESVNALGFDYLLNYRVIDDRLTEIGRFENGKYAACGEADYSVSGNVMQIRIPLKAIGLSADDRALEFRVSDNVTSTLNVLDFYSTGDSAPIGGLNYSYGY